MASSQCHFSIKQVAGGYLKRVSTAAGFKQLGLMQDDAIYENDDVKEALRRLPETLYDDRACIKRAVDSHV